MASSVGGQEENQNLQCDWLLKQVRWLYLTHSGLATHCVLKKNYPLIKPCIINLVVNKLVRSR